MAGRWAVPLPLVSGPLAGDGVGRVLVGVGEVADAADHEGVQLAVQVGRVGGARTLHLDRAGVVAVVADVGGEA